MKIIYEPKGKAKEYATLAVNLYKGCTHGCRYCFAPKIPWISSEEYYTDASPKDDAIEKLKKDVRKLGEDTPEILLSFQGDVYQPAEMDLQLTRQAIQVFIENSLPFTILTKGGTRAVRDFDLLEHYDRCRLGTTLVFWNQSDADHWEPNAPSIYDRVKAMKLAHEKGIRTWVSLEPVIDPAQALEIIQTLHPIVDHWKVGKINHNREIEAMVDWLKFRGEVKELLDALGADYYLKKSLTEL